MTIPVRCECGHWLKVGDESAGSRGECPACGRVVTLTPLPSDESAPAYSQHPTPLEVTSFLDAPSTNLAAADNVPPVPVFRRMLEALLDPRAIHWMLLIGGGLSVLGLIIWLVSIGVFDDPRNVAAALGAGSLAILGGGWATTLKSRYLLAGKALTFLGCVVTPLNLWFYHSQNLLTIDQHLWIGGLICVGLYAVTVRMLRDPLFMYAVEAGITLTTLLVMADLNLIHDTGHLALFLISLGAISIHAERAFPSSGAFDRQRFGLPLFWSGHAQLGTGLALLLSSQVIGWLAMPLGIEWPGDFVTRSSLLAGGLWIAGGWLYLYSDLIVRQKSVHTWLATLSLVMAELTLTAEYVNEVGFIAVTALTALVLQVIRGTLVSQNTGFRNQLATIAAVLSVLPVLLGTLLYVQGPREIIASIGLGVEASSWFAAALLLTAVCNITSAVLCRQSHPRVAAAHHYLGTFSLLIAASSALNEFAVTQWSLQALALMLLPILYIVAARCCRGLTAETPLARAAHGLTIIILGGAFIASFGQGTTAFFHSARGHLLTLQLAGTFSLATVFYALAGWFRGRGWNAYLATAAACTAMGHALGYYGVPETYYPLTYAVLGLIALALGRAWGIVPRAVNDSTAEPVPSLPGKGLTAFQCGTVVTSVALLAALLRGIGQLSGTLEWRDLITLAATAATGFAAIWVVPQSDWRRWFAMWTGAIGIVGLLMINQLSILTGWQKLEVFSVFSGLMLLAAGHIGLFKENGKRDESISLGLWLGSLLAATPLFIAMCFHRFEVGDPSLIDELALLTVSTAMLVSGCSWRIKSTTILGGSVLLAYLVILVASVAYRPEVAIGVYLLVGGALIFAIGVLLSIYRDRLMQLPEMIAKRNGIFRVIGWR